MKNLERSQDHRIRQKKTNDRTAVDFDNKKIRIARNQSDNLNHNSSKKEDLSKQESYFNVKSDGGNANQIIRQKVLYSEISNNNIEEDEPIDGSL